MACNRADVFAGKPKLKAWYDQMLKVRELIRISIPRVLLITAGAFKRRGLSGRSEPPFIHIATFFKVGRFTVW